MHLANKGKLIFKRKKNFKFRRYVMVTVTKRVWESGLSAVSACTKSVSAADARLNRLIVTVTGPPAKKGNLLRKDDVSPEEVLFQE